MDDLAAEVMRGIAESPEYYLETMAAAYMREFDVPIENLALVELELTDGGKAYFFSNLDEILDADADAAMG